MIDFKKLSAAAILLSLVSSGAAMPAYAGGDSSDSEDSDSENTGSPKVKRSKVPVTPSNSGDQPPINGNTIIPALPAIPHDNEEAVLLRRLHEIRLEKLQKETEKAKLAAEELENLRRRVQEAEKVRQEEEVERLKQAAFEEQRRAEEAEKYRLELERLAQEAEAAKQAQQAAEAKRQSEQKASAVLLGGRTPERAAHNVDTEVTRGIESLGNALAGKGWNHNKKVKRKEKKKAAKKGLKKLKKAF
jgi:hypothetical protein